MLAALQDVSDVCEHFANRTAKDGVGEVIERRAVAIDDDEAGTVLFGGNRQVRGRGHHERGADGQHEVGGTRPAGGFHEDIGGQRLAKRDGGVFESAAAGGAIGDTVLGNELGDEWLDVEAGVAIEASGLAGRAMEFEHAAAAGELMEAIDVLRDNAADAAGGFPLGKCEVANVRLGGRELGVHFALLAPVLVAAVGTFHEFVEVDGAILRPDATGRAEVGDAALGADARAGEDDGGIGVGEPVRDLRDVSAIRRSHFPFATEDTDSTEKRIDDLRFTICDSEDRQSQALEMQSSIIKSSILNLWSVPSNFSAVNILGLYGSGGPEKCEDRAGDEAVGDAVDDIGDHFAAEPDAVENVGRAVGEDAGGADEAKYPHVIFTGR